MNIRIVAALLFAGKELEELERTLKRKRDWRTARRIAHVRSLLVQVLDGEQESLQALYAEYQDAPDQALRH